MGARPASIKRHEQERRAERRRAERRNQPGERRRGSAVGTAWREICLYLLAVLSSGEGVAWAWISVFFAPSCVLSSRLLFAFRFRSVWVRRGVKKTKKKQNVGSNVAARNDESATTRRPGGGPPFGQSFPRNMASKIKSFL